MLGSNARYRYASHSRPRPPATRHRQVDKWDAEVPLTAEWSGPVRLIDKRETGRAAGRGRPGRVRGCNRDSGGGNASCRVCYCLDWFAGVSQEPQRQRLGEAWTGCIRHANSTSRHHTVTTDHRVRALFVFAHSQPATHNYCCVTIAIAKWNLFDLLTVVTVKIINSNSNKKEIMTTKDFLCLFYCLYFMFFFSRLSLFMSNMQYVLLLSYKLESIYSIISARLLHIIRLDLEIWTIIFK